MVSVVIATYRRDTTLRRAIQSVLEQTYRETEIIVVDDNNDPAWNKRVESVMAQFPQENIRYFQNREHLGSGATRNVGIAHAAGEFVTFLDDDDYYLPPKIEHQLEDLIKSEADFSITDLFLYDENEKVISKRIRGYLHGDDRESLFQAHLIHHLTGTDTFLFRKAYLTAIGGFPGIGVGDEFYLMKEAICGGGKFRYTPGCYVKAYVHRGESDGLSSGPGKIRGENDLFAYKKRFFDQIDGRARRYICARHHAVLAFAYWRMNAYGRFLFEALAAFFVSPVSCLKIVTGSE
ncbi:MAG: glycosyltransferase family 2 protein [Clostridia bacterium]|nr:glycosyltransferase family 2 protein [Clostridia bacterium]